MKSYLQIHIPLNHKSPWFQDLRARLTHVPKRWYDHFHLTIAFIKDELTMDGARDVAGILRNTLYGINAPVVTFDKVDAFTNQAGTEHIVNLTAREDQPALSAIVNKVRTELGNHGYHLGPYRLHVTLTRIKTDNIDLKTLQDIISEVEIQPFSLTLTHADYRFSKERTRTIEEWHWMTPEQRRAQQAISLDEVKYYFEREFLWRDLKWLFRVRRKDGCRIIREAEPDLDERSREFTPSFLWDDRKKVLFWGLIGYIIVAEQAIRDIAGEGCLLDFLRISRWPLFVLPEGFRLDERTVFPNMPDWGYEGITKSIRSDSAEVMAGFVLSELDHTLFCGMNWRLPEHQPAGLFESHRNLMDMPDDVKQSILERYNEIRRLCPCL